MSLVVRDAAEADLPAVAEIYNEGIRGRLATFETRERTAADVRAWLDDPRHPMLVAERAGAVVGWISALCRRHGFREVGLYRNHARLDGAWRDVVTVERLIPGNQA
jgi:L-amino acid N-acyltransferase YncA